MLRDSRNSPANGRRFKRIISRTETLKRNDYSETAIPQVYLFSIPQNYKTFLDHIVRVINLLVNISVSNLSFC